MASSVPRSYSDKFLPGQADIDLVKNKNVEWMNYPYVRATYVLFILFMWGILHMSQVFTAAECWTATNIIHGVATFFLLHWVKGCPDDSTQGEYNAQTLYEQIDAGTPWTRNKKFLMLVPTALAWVSCHVADYKPIYVLVNGGMFVICIIAKIPMMHRVRIFGINSTPGIDTKIEYAPKKRL